MVLIDMEKPKECQKCPFCNVDGDCTVIPYEMYQHCPLKEVQR